MATFTMWILQISCPADLPKSFTFDATSADRDWSQNNHYHTLERLKEGGGMTWCELAAILNHRKWQKMDQHEAYQSCLAREIAQ